MAWRKLSGRLCRNVIFIPHVGCFKDAVWAKFNVVIIKQVEAMWENVTIISQIGDCGWLCECVTIISQVGGYGVV